jgi:predicted dehydrogenase
MHTWKAAIVGCGQIAGGYDASAPEDFIRTHARAYASCPETNLAAVMDVDPVRARVFAGRWQVPKHYDVLAELLERERCEIVSICTPDERHADDLRTCLEFPSVRAIWCEKPLALDITAAQSLVTLAQAQGVILAVDYQRQWEPAHQILAKEIRSGAWGRILGAHAAYSKGILHNGSHLIHLLRDFLGEPEKMQVHRAFCEYSPIDPTVDATLIFSGVPVRITGLPVPPYPVFEMTMYAEQGVIRLADSGRRIFRYRRNPEEADTLPAPHETGTQLDRALRFVLDDICRALRGKDPVRVDGEEALKTLKLCSQLAEQGLSL